MDWGLYLVWIIVLWVVFTPHKYQSENINHVDKVAHFGVFFGQFCLLGHLLNINNKTKALFLWVVALLWAVVSELIQGYFTARTMDIWDGVADMVGASLAIRWVYWWRGE